MSVDDLPDFLADDDFPSKIGAPSDPILDGLTEPQREAVVCTEGPLLVLAAAGSGKTRVITRRIAKIIENGAPPWSILALTFTNKAAGEMRERVAKQLDPDSPEPMLVRGLTITTFHSLCARLLRRYAERAELPGLKPDYTIYDSADQMGTMKRVIKNMGLQASNWPPRSVLSTISTAKNEMLDAKAFSASAFDYYAKQIAKIFENYEQELRRAGAIDFDDLLLLTAKMFKTNEDIRAECASRWRYLLIDEYQDTNSVQFQIASLLARSPGDLPGSGSDDGDEPNELPNICVVGDPDQSIYGWRGADISNILDFEEHYPGAKVITLGQNFRSTSPILAAADTLIKRNKKRKDKPLFTDKVGGEPVKNAHLNDEHEEADFVAETFRALHNDHNIEWRDMAVFYRTNALSRVVEDAMRQNAIPYTIARGTAFYEREEIKSALAYLRVVANTSDTVSLLRIINTPTRGIGKKTLDIIQGAASRAGMPLFEGLSRASELGLSDRAVGAVDRFVEMINDWNGSGSFMGAKVSSTLTELLVRVIDESGLERYYTKQARTSGAESDEERIDNLAELVSSAREFEIEYDPSNDPAAFTDEQQASEGSIGNVPPLLGLLRSYLESIALIADADAVDNENGAVTLMTLHASKGLEFPAAAIVGLEEGLLPHSRAQTSEAELEEERRLAFVGITRAQTHLLMTSADRRTVRGITERTIRSRFFSEIGREHILVDDRARYNDTSYDDAFDDDTSIQSESSRQSVRHDYGVDKIKEAREKRLAKPVERPSIGTTRNSAPSAPTAHEFEKGALVAHPQFGRGVVMSCTHGANARVTVEFKGLGRKTLVLEYARLKRLS